MFTFVTTACSLDASLENLAQTVKEGVQPTITTSQTSVLALAPSTQMAASDMAGEYTVKSAVGEVMTTEEAKTNDNVYRAEISITYQKM